MCLIFAVGHCTFGVCPNWLGNELWRSGVYLSGHFCPSVVADRHCSSKMEQWSIGWQTEPYFCNRLHGQNFKQKFRWVHSSATDITRIVGITIQMWELHLKFMHTSSNKWSLANVHTKYSTSITDQKTFFHFESEEAEKLKYPQRSMRNAGMLCNFSLTQNMHLKLKW